MGPEIRISRPNASSWPEAFAISATDLRDWMANLQPGETVLTWAVRNGMISVTDYMEWAQKHHQLPILSTQYTDQLPEKNQWVKWEKLGSWKADFFPIGEWDGIIYVGLIDPESPIDLEQAFVRILVHPSDLDTMWNYFTGTRALKPVVMPDIPTSNADQAPDGLKWSLPSETKTSDFGHIPSVSHTELPEGLTNPGVVNFGRGKEEEAIKPPDMPAGLDESTYSGQSKFSVTISRPDAIPPEPGKKPKLPPLPNSAKSAVRPPEPPAAKPPLFQRNNKPAEMSPSDEITKSFAKPNFELAKPEPVREDSVTSFPLSEPPSPPPPPPAAPSRSTTSSKSVPLAEVSQSKSQSFRELEEARTLTNISKLTFGEKTNAEGLPGIVDPKAVDFTTFEKCGSYEQLSSAAIINIQKYFEHAMLLMFRNNELRPWRWSEHWMPTFEKVAPVIPLEDASLFRIVYRTNLPYHGHIVSNPVNEKFFMDWNRGALPKHITLVPLFIDKKIFGMVCGLNNETVPQPGQMTPLLRTMDRLAEELNTHFKRLRAKAPAA